MLQDSIKGVGMKTQSTLIKFIMAILVIVTLKPGYLSACSTFQFKHGDDLLFGHNLNEPEMDVPGLIFINKRGILKHGRSFSELVSKTNENPSNVIWISRYGSITMNNFGKDFADGGINEAGLYIWEMNEETDYPQNKKLPRLMHMNWMQYVLDNYSTTEEVIQSTSKFQIDGWTWHYFVSDAQGNAASIEFFNGKVVVHQGDQMPVPALFNTPYAREMELIKYYKGFGGQYEVDFNNPEVPRFVKTAKMLKEYKGESPVDYSIEMLKKIKVYETPDWSVLIDTKKKMFYFKTSLYPEMKYFSYENIDFSNKTPCQILNIDIAEGTDVLAKFKPYTDEMMKKIIDQLPIPEEGFLPKGSVSVTDFKNRLLTHHYASLKPETQFFAGNWKTETSKDKNAVQWEVRLLMNKDAVTGEIIRTNETTDIAKIDHIYIKDNKLYMTYISVKAKNMVELVAEVKGNKMYCEPFVGDQSFAPYTLIKQ
jgi:choloylglycine hydrolase